MAKRISEMSLTPFLFNTDRLEVSRAGDSGDYYVSASVLLARRFGLDIKLQGAILDGDSHPVSEWFPGSGKPWAGLYANLAAVQAKCPNVTSDSEECDFAAIDATKRILVMNGGGTMYGGFGTAVVKKSTVLPHASEGVDTASGKVVRRGTPVSFVGEPGGAFIMHWREHNQGVAFNPDTHKFILDSEDCYTSGKGGAGLIAHILFKGPGGNVGFGNVNCNVSGVRTGARRVVADCYFQDLFYGVEPVGDHTSFDRLTARSCFIGRMIGRQNPDSYGDIKYRDNKFDACWFACVCVGPETNGQKGSETAPIYATSPFAWYKIYSLANPASMVGFDIFDAMAESIANGGWCGGADPRVGGCGDGTNGTVAQGSWFPNLESSGLHRIQLGAWNSAYKIPSWRLCGWVNAARASDFQIRRLRIPSLARNAFAGDVPKILIDIRECFGVVLEMPVGELADAMTAKGAGYALFGPWGPGFYNSCKVIDTQEGWEGEVTGQRDGFAIPKFSTVMASNAACVVSDGTKPFRGIARCGTPAGNSLFDVQANSGAGANKTLYLPLIVRKTGSGMVRVADGVAGDALIMTGTGSDAGKMVAWTPADGAARLRGTAFNPEVQNVDGVAGVRVAYMQFELGL